jgi:hypothetical protein
MKTPFLDQVYEQVDFDRDLVFKFFTVFSLFEYALKKTGFCDEGRGGDVQADWRSFALEIHPLFKPASTPELNEAVEYMGNRPVKKQVFRDDLLTFVPRQHPRNINETVWLSILIRGVRNNLFHGGKYRFDRPRDPDLINWSLTILESWARLHPDVERELINVQ